MEKEQLFSMLLRLLPLAAKLALTLYMGRYLTLADMGTYGLVFGSVMLVNAVAGQSISFVVGRDVVHASPLAAAHKMRDQALLYAANYFVLGLIAVLVIGTGFGGITPRIVLYTFLLSTLEGYAGMTNINMNSLNQQLMSNSLFFIRSGLWIVPVVALGTLNPAFRNVDVVLIAWMGGAVCSLVGTMVYWRKLPWREAVGLPVDWDWLKQGLRKSSLIWLGAIGLSLGTYIDRFVVERYLSLDDVGVMTFYFSFANAMLTLMQSGVLAFSFPRLVNLHREGQNQKFVKEARYALMQVAVGAGLIAIVLGLMVPLLGRYLHREALVSSSWTLWLMLYGTWLRSNAETLNCVLYARHQDRAIWLGNLLFLIPAICGNLLLVPFIGLPGIGCAMIAAALFILIWRWHHVGGVFLARHTA